MFRDPVVRVLVGVALVTALGFAPTAAAGGSDPTSGAPAFARAAWAEVDEALGSVRWLLARFWGELLGAASPAGVPDLAAGAAAEEGSLAPPPFDNGGPGIDPDG